MKWLFFFIPDAPKKPAKKTLSKKELSPKQKHYLSVKRKEKPKT